MPAPLSHCVLSHRPAGISSPCAPTPQASTRDTFRPHRRHTLAPLLLALALGAGLLALILGPGLPDSWWPQTGNAFAASAEAPRAPAPEHTTTPASTTRPASDPCDAIVGPAHAYCERADTDAPAPTTRQQVAWAGTLLAAPALLTVVALVRRHRRS